MSELAQTEFEHALGLSAPPARGDASRLRSFVTLFSALRDDTDVPAEILQAGRVLLAELIAHDDWLPDAFAAPAPHRFQQYLLHCDSGQRFSVVSMVRGPGQSTPVHDHAVWGLVGVLRGAELAQRFTRGPGGGPWLPQGAPKRLVAGSIREVVPGFSDAHQVSNAHIDRVSVSIHVYGANIAAVERRSYDPTGRPKPFACGYANRLLPNFWGKP